MKTARSMLIIIFTTLIVTLLFTLQSVLAEASAFRDEQLTAFHGHNSSTYTFMELGNDAAPAYDPRFTDGGEVANNKDWTIQFSREVDALAGIFVSTLSTDVQGMHRVTGVGVEKDLLNPRFVLVKAPAGGYPGGDYYLFVNTVVTSGGKALPQPIRMKFSVQQMQQDHPFAGGSGTAADPYQITTARQLHEVRNYHDKNFIQVAHLDLNSAALSAEPWYDTSAGWDPVGIKENWESTNPFTGVYDGNGYKISNLTIERPGEQAVGLFGSVEDGLIRNVTLEQVNVRGRIQVGALVGSNRGTVTNSSVQGNVQGEWSWTGGLAGSNYGTITGSSAAGTVSSDGDFVGGLAGYNHQPTGRINNSYASSTVSGTGQNNANVGGLAGRNDGEIKDSYATGNVNAKGTVGGLVGSNNANGTVSHCYATGNVKGDRHQFTGGLVGYNFGQEHDNITNSYWNTDTSNQSESAGGAGKSNAAMKQQATFVDWDFVNIWQIEEGQRYPYLRQQGAAPVPAPVTDYQQLTLSHFGFSFKEGITVSLDNPLTMEEQDGYLGGSAVYVGYGEDPFPAHLGTVELSSIADMSSIVFPETAQSLQVGHVYVARCRTGYVKFKVISLDVMQAVAEVEYMYSASGVF